MAENNNNQQGLQMNLDPEVAKGVYSNLALISHSHSDFILDFARFLPGMPKADVATRVILAPEHAKRLLAALQENIMRYEQEFGKIQMAQPQQTPTDVPSGTATPFGVREA